MKIARNPIALSLLLASGLFSAAALADVKIGFLATLSGNGAALGQDMVGAVLASQMSGETPVVGQGTGEAIAMLTDTTPGATDSPADAAPVVLQDPPPQVVSARSRRPLWIAAAVVGVALVVQPADIHPAVSVLFYSTP